MVLIIKMIVALSMFLTPHTVSNPDRPVHTGKPPVSVPACGPAQGGGGDC
jgi:hypothetical protein